MANSKLTTERRRAVVEDVIWLTDCGEHPENVARRVGYRSPETLARALQDWDEHSLARRLNRSKVPA